MHGMSLGSSLCPRLVLGAERATSVVVHAYQPQRSPNPGGGYAPRAPPNQGGGRYGNAGPGGARPDYLDLSQGQRRAPPGGGGGYDSLFGVGPRSRPRPPMYDRPPPGMRSRDDLGFDDDDDDGPGGRRSRTSNNERRTVNGKPLLINEEINATEVRVQGPGKEQLGVRDFNEVMEIAEADDMDVVLINGDQSPPLVRIIAWNKYKFEVEKGQKAKKAGSTVLDIKEIRMKPRTDTNDINIKVNSAMKFLKKGHKVKLSMKFVGRELQFRDQGKEVLLGFIQQIGPAAKVEGPLNFKTGTYTVMLAPETGAPAV